MNYNPYAPPAAGPPPPPPFGGQPGAPQPWDIGEVVSLAWSVFKRNWPVLVGSTLIMGFATSLPFVGAAPFFMGDFQDMLHQTNPFSPASSSGLTWGLRGTGLAVTIIQSFFLAGLIRIWLSAVRGGSPQIGELFQGGARFVPLLGLALLLYIPYQVGALLIVPAFFVYVLTWGAEFYVVDAGLSPIDALKAYLNAARGQWGPMMLLALVTIMFYVAGFAACCVGFLVAMPVAQLAKSIVYLRISGAAGAPPAAPFGGPPMGYGGPPPGYPPPGGQGGPPPGYGPPPGGYGGPPPGYGPPGGGGYGGGV